MRSSARRSFKYSKKITARVLPGQAAGYMASLPIRRRIEECVKTAGITPMLQIPYIAYLEELIKHASGNKPEEAAIILNKWEMRGLDNATLTALGYCVGMTPAAAPPPPPCEYSCDPNTLALYHCDTGAGVILVDSCGAFNADFKGPGEPAWTIDYKCPTHAVHFDGIDDHITQATILDTFPANGTIEFWFKLNAEINPIVSTGVNVLYKLNRWSPGPNYLQVYFASAGAGADAGKIMFDLRVAGVSHLSKSTTSTWLAGVWYHVAFTWGATGMKTWVGAVNEGSHPFTGVPVAGNQCDLFIGRYCNTSCVPGAIALGAIVDEIRISDIQRTTFIL